MDLSFLNAGLLAGAAFIAVPIVLHLIMRQQPRHLEFPALRFLRVRQEANTRRLKLRHLLLLLLRTAAICLLAAALARPRIQASGFLSQEAPVAAVLICDTSPKMEYQHANRTRLDVVREMALDLVSKLPRESQVAVVDGQAAGPQFAVDASTARSQIERLAATSVARPLPEQLAAALRTLHEKEGDNIRREVYIFTDRAAASWASENPEALRQQLTELADIGVYVIDVGVDEPRNFGLGELHLSRQLLAQRSPLEIRADLLRAGPESERKVELRLLQADGTFQKRDEQQVAWKPGETGQLEFRIAELPPGVHQGVVRIVGEDGLPADNERFFTVDVRRAWPVLIAAPRVEETVYFVEAIAPSVLRDQARFAPRVVPQAKLSDERLAEFRAVCLLDPAPLPVETWEQLADYVKAGGSLFIALGPSAELSRFNETVPRSLLPGGLRFQSRQVTFLAPDHLNHAVLSKFAAVEGAIPWSEFPVERHWMFDALDPTANQIIRFANRDPALVEKPVGKGIVVTMTTPLSSDPDPRQPRWNRLTVGADPEPWPFVMLANELLLYLVGSEDERFNYRPGETVVLPAGAGEIPPNVSLLAPDGTQTRADVDPLKNGLVFTATNAPGNYRVRAGGAVGGFDRGFSVNLDPAVTQLERLPQAKLTELLGEGRYRLATSGKSIEREQGRGRVGQELFPYIMALVALILAGEQVLANRFYRREA